MIREGCDEQRLTSVAAGEHYQARFLKLVKIALETYQLMLKSFQT
jgi:hypothetical protein